MLFVARVACPSDPLSPARSAPSAGSAGRAGRAGAKGGGLVFPVTATLFPDHAVLGLHVACGGEGESKLTRRGEGCRV